MNISLFKMKGSVIDDFKLSVKSMNKLNPDSSDKQPYNSCVVLLGKSGHFSLFLRSLIKVTLFALTPQSPRIE